MAGLFESLGRSQALSRTSSDLLNTAMEMRRTGMESERLGMEKERFGEEKKVNEARLAVTNLQLAEAQKVHEAKSKSYPISSWGKMFGLGPETVKAISETAQGAKIGKVGPDGEFSMTGYDRDQFVNMLQSGEQIRTSVEARISGSMYRDLKAQSDALDTKIAQTKNPKELAALQKQATDLSAQVVSAHTRWLNADDAQRQFEAAQALETQKEEARNKLEIIKEAGSYKRESMKEAERTKRSLSREKTLREIAAGKKEEKGQPTAQNFNTAIAANEKAGMKHEDSVRLAAEDIREATGSYPKAYKPKPYKVGDLFKGAKGDIVSQVTETKWGQVVTLSDGTNHYADE